MKLMMTFSKLLLGTLVVALPTAWAHDGEFECRLSDIRLGHFDQPGCTLDTEELLRAIDLYEARKEGPTPWEPPKKPNLKPTDMREGIVGGNTLIEGQVRVANTGRAGARAFDVAVIAEFIRLDDDQIRRTGPVTIRMQGGLAARAEAWTDWLSSVAYLMIPSPDPDYLVTLTATVDPQNRIDESNETDNVYRESCRTFGYGDGQGRPLGMGERAC